MWFFNKKKDQNDQESLSKRLKKAENDILELYMDMDLLRDKVLRKIQTKRSKPEDQIDQKEFKGILTPEQARQFKINGGE